MHVRANFQRFPAAATSSTNDASSRRGSVEIGRRRLGHAVRTTQNEKRAPRHEAMHALHAWHKWQAMSVNSHLAFLLSKQGVKLGKPTGGGVSGVRETGAFGRRIRSIERKC